MVAGVSLVCPTCRRPLVGAADSLACGACGARWPVVEGIPHFVSEDQYWGEIDQEDMRRINNEIRRAPWREVLLRHPAPQVRKASEMMMNCDRANWHLFLPLSREATVLDIGAGSGAIAEAMARFYGHVIAMEPVLERIEFMRERFRQEGLANVTLVRSHVGQVPVSPGSVDLAIFNGVLEWVPWSTRAGRPRDVQRQALRGVQEVLRPGGFVCVGIENRWHPNFFMGANDPHADIPYVTILPRSLADLYSRWRTGEPYRSYLYSAGGYRRLLREAGFTDVQLYCALRSYNHPSFIIPLEDDLITYYSDTFGPQPQGSVRRAATRCLRRLGLEKSLVHSFFVIGRKRDG